MADQLEGARTSPVLFHDFGDGAVGERVYVVIGASLPAGTNVIGQVQISKQSAAAQPATLAAGTTGAAFGAPANAAGRLLGYGIRETTGTATATARFYDGTSNAGTPLGAGVTLAANESVREWFGPTGIVLATGVYVDRTAGTTEVTVFWGPA